MSFSFCFSPMRRAALFALAFSLGQGENLFSGSCGIRCRQYFLLSGICDTRCRQCFLLFWRCGIRYRQCLLLSAVCGIRYRQCLLILALWHSVQAMLFSFLPFVAFGTGESLLWYGICVPCSKQAPGVRDAFSEAFGAKNRRFRYRRDIRCAEQPSVVRGASWIFGAAPLSGTEQITRC